MRLGRITFRFTDGIAFGRIMQSESWTYYIGNMIVTVKAKYPDRHKKICWNRIQSNRDGRKLWILKYARR